MTRLQPFVSSLECNRSISSVKPEKCMQHDAFGHLLLQCFEHSSGPHLIGFRKLLRSALITSGRSAKAEQCSVGARALTISNMWQG